jgi:hypothetical protein
MLVNNVLNKKYSGLFMNPGGIPSIITIVFRHL